MKERRRFIRLNSAISVNYKKLDSAAQEEEIFSRNISEGGICLIVGDRLNEGDLLKLNISIPRHRTIINVNGRVVWIREIPVAAESGKKTFRAGIEFVGIDRQAARQIEEYVHSSLFDVI